MNLEFEINKDKKIYIQIYEKIKNDIILSLLKKDDKLPSKRKYATILNVSINSVQSAYNILLEEGYIYSKYKKGYFVNNIFFKEKKDINIQKEIKILEKPIYDLTTSNILDLEISKNIINKLARNILTDGNYFQRVDSFGYLKLKEAISKLLYDQKDIIAHPNQIIISNSSNNLIKMIIELLNIKKIAVETPGYYNPKSLFIDCDYINVDKQGFSAKEFENSSAKIGLITSFSEFPLGIKMPLERKLELVNILNNKNKIIIEDSFDSSFRNNGYQTTPLFNMSDKVIYLESFSRTIYPGLCISFMVLPNWLINDFYNHFKDISSSISTFDQQLAAEYIDRGYYNRHINKLRTSFLNRKKLIEKNLDNDLFEIYSDLNYSSILVKIKKDINIQLFKKELEKEKIKINFLSNFCKTNIYDNILIIGFSNINEANLIVALEKIKKILRKI